LKNLSEGFLFFKKFYFREWGLILNCLDEYERQKASLDKNQMASFDEVFPPLSCIKEVLRPTGQGCSQGLGGD